MTDSTQIFERLKQDHDRHRELLDKICDTSGDTEERNELFTELTKELKSHAAAEEQALYSTMLRKPPTTDETRHSVAEHHEIDEMLNDLAATDMSTGGWLLKFQQFEEKYRHHIKEEEKEVFALARQLIDDKEAEQLAKEFDERKSHEMSS